MEGYRTPHSVSTITEHSAMISSDRAYLSRTEIAVFNVEDQREGGEKPPRTRRRNGIANFGISFQRTTARSST